MLKNNIKNEERNSKKYKKFLICITVIMLIFIISALLQSKSKKENKIGNVITIDDYAHHPTEIKATINAIKQKYPDKLIISIFQPHTFFGFQFVLLMNH